MTEIDEKEGEVLDHQLDGLPTTGRGARTVFTFATPLDLAIIAISCFAAIVAGGLNPLLTAGNPSLLSVNTYNCEIRFCMVSL